MSHLKRHASGHLTLHASGHIALYVPISYSAVVQPSPYWSGYATVNIPVSTITGEQVATLVSAAISNYAFVTNYSSPPAPNINISASFGGIGYTSAFVEHYARIWRIVPSSGIFGSPVVASIVMQGSIFAPPYQSEWPSTGCSFRVGTGSSSPTGDPRGWAANLFSGGVASSTQYNVSLSEYVWCSFDVSPWSGQADDLRGDGGRGLSGSVSFGSISA